MALLQWLAIDFAAIEKPATSRMIGLRFRRDPYVPDERFETLRREFGERFEPIELDPADANPDALTPPHSVLTFHLRDNDPEGPTRKAEARVIAFLRKRLGAIGS